MALTVTNNGRCVAVGATSGDGGNSTGLSMTAGAASSKTSSGTVMRVAWQSFDGGEPAGPDGPRPPGGGTGDRGLEGPCLHRLDEPGLRAAPQGGCGGG
jgi:hypothetical protein